jgi:hypothetical protein
VGVAPPEVSPKQDLGTSDHEQEECVDLLEDSPKEDATILIHQLQLQTMVLLGMEVEEISVPDVDPDSFLALLKYVYCDDIYLEPDNVLATLYAAKKYIVPHLARECVKYLETSLTARNACLLLSQSRLFEEPELMQRCWDVIDAQAEIALRSDGFTDIDFHTLETILARETLNCKEIVVFEGSPPWPWRSSLTLPPSLVCCHCRKLQTYSCTSQQSRNLP